MSVYGHQFAVVFKNTNTSAMKALRVLIAWSLASGVFRVYAIVFVQEPSYFSCSPVKAGGRRLAHSLHVDFRRVFIARLAHHVSVS